MTINCSDVYDQENLEWLEDARSDISVLYKSTLTEVRDLTVLQLKMLLAEMINHPSNEDESAISNFHKIFKEKDDNKIVNAKEIINSHFDNLILNESNDISFITGKLSRFFIDLLFFLRIVPYERDPRTTCLRLEEPSLIMPAKEYYFSEDSFYLNIRESYISLIMNILENLGYVDTCNLAQGILSIERQLSLSKISEEDSRNPEKLCNTLTHSKFNELSDLNINLIASGAGIPLPNVLVVDSFRHLETLNKLISTFSPDVFLAYAKVKFSIEFFDFIPLSSAVIADFLYSKLATRRRKNADELVNDYICEYFSEYISMKYKEEYFSSSVKHDIEGMILNIRDSFVENVKCSNWMSQAYKDNAEKKLYGIRIKVGGSDIKSKYNYVENATLLDNVLLLLSNKFELTAGFLNSQLDEKLWDLHAHEVNACYNRRKNEIIIPASLLQPPLYNQNSTLVENYGMIGVIIAHEISHAIDDEGCFFDENGALFSLWSETDKAYFYSQANRLAARYSSIEIIPGLHIDGILTRGEAIADFIGCRMAYFTLKKIDTSSKNVLGEFIRQVCVLWREHASEEVVHRLTTVGPHAPAKYRALISLSYIENKNAVISGLFSSHKDDFSIGFI